MSEEAMNERADRIAGRMLEERLDRALAAAPALPPAENFAARVAASLPEVQPSPAAAPHYGYAAVLLCGAALLVAMCLVGWARPHGSQGVLLLELLLSAELVALVLSAGPWSRALRWPD